MSKNWQLGAALCAGIALVALRGEASEVRGQDDLEARVESLERTLVELEAANAELVATFGTTRALVDETVSYLEAQAESAAAMSSTLTRSEELGFTAGINFESREVLVAGWRDRLKAIETGLPGAKKKQEETAAAEGGERGRR